MSEQRLIDANALLERVDEERKYLLERGLTGAEHILVHNFRDLIDNAPTVEAYTSEDLVKYISATEDLVQEKLDRSQDEWICPNCDLYEQAEDNYCQYAGECTIGCHKCRYFKQKGGAE